MPSNIKITNTHLNDTYINARQIFIQHSGDAKLFVCHILYCQHPTLYVFNLNQKIGGVIFQKLTNNIVF